MRIKAENRAEFPQADSYLEPPNGKKQRALLPGASEGF